MNVRFNLGMGVERAQSLGVECPQRGKDRGRGPGRGCLEVPEGTSRGFLRWLSNPTGMVLCSLESWDCAEEEISEKASQGV